MVGNLQGDAQGKILVEFDQNNLILVDPNKTIDNQGKISERLVDHENLVMYANLEADLLPRTKLAVGTAPNEGIQTISVAKINFLKPNQGKFLSDGYYDELTGLNSLNNNGQNQMLEIENKSQSAPYFTDRVFDQNNIIDNGLLGITSIRITTNSSFIPSVKIELEDVQGKALFQLGDNSPYSAFFNLPYPQFYLTLKGYYGQAIRYQLNLEKFNARYNSFSGNYQVTLEFRGYKFNILNEISIGNLLATPHMYNQTFNIGQSPTQIEGTDKDVAANVNANSVNGNNSSVNQNTLVSQVNTEIGYQKIREVYSEYKSRGLVSQDLPELTLVQLMNKLQKFEDLIVDQYPKANLEPLTNIREYKKYLINYYNSVRGSTGSWFNRYLDPNPVVLTNKKNVYLFKRSVLVDKAQQAGAIEDLKSKINEFNKLLAGNETLGVKKPNEIRNIITYDLIHYTNDREFIDWFATTKSQTGLVNPTQVDVQKVKNSYSNLLNVVISPENGVTFESADYFIFEGDLRFDKEIQLMETKANQLLSEYELTLSADLARRFEDSTFGIGFKPTVRNIIAVIMANTEGFIRLMDDVHTDAWQVRNDPVRKNAILNNPASIPSSDKVNDDDPVYPWPQFFTESNDGSKNRYQLTYLADPSVVDLTQAYLYEKWPEVEFVEEYLKGITLKFNSPNFPDPLTNDRDTNLITINPIEFPQRGLPYVNKTEVKFFYEIWERQFLTSHYSNFIRSVNNNQVNSFLNLNSQTEINNIITSLGTSSPFLTYKLKNYGFNSSNYVEDVLENMSNEGTGKSYQEFIRDIFVTPYLKNITENSFSILSLLDLGKDPQQSPPSSALENFVKLGSNDPIIVDTLPFTNNEWVVKNMEQGNKNSGNQVYNTNNTLKVYGYRNLISNFTDIYNFTENRPVTNFSFYNIKHFDIPQRDLREFYLTRVPNNFVATEGDVYYQSPTKNLSLRKTTSMLNTPYFVNSILNGVYNNRRKDLYPYVQSAYLFLNSLPLATLRERYKTRLSEGTTTELDYISSVFKKFAGIHKVPYAWVLKYGSIWYRYKKFKEDNVDILDGIWENFNYVDNYSPIQKNKQQEYTFNYEGSSTTIVLQQETTQTIDLQVGFYPKVINDFNYFYNGYDLYVDYTNEEIQKSINNGVKLYNFGRSNINGVLSGSKIFSEKTWSVVIPRLDVLEPEVECEVLDNTKLGDYFIVPSFGTTYNQTYTECVTTGGVFPSTKVQVTDNSSIYNGSVRMLWGGSNFGYFDNDQIVMPRPDQYINKIFSGGTQSPFQLLGTDGYSNIEELFSVFEKSILDQFELEFLNFCKSSVDLTIPNDLQLIEDSNNDGDSLYRNFQSLFKSLMSVRSKSQEDTEGQYFLSLINTQYLDFQSGIKSFLEYDVILRYGNPSNYRRRIFDSYLSHLSNEIVVQSPIKFNPYVPNSLPSSGGTTTLSQSKLLNPDAWTALETEVGFSTIKNVEYTSNGSYFTDFFIDNNIEFSKDNVELLSPLIKMYATQKLNRPSLNRTQFQNSLSSYLQSNENFQNILLNDILTKLQRDLPEQQQLPERTIASAIDGQQGKVETYEMFKALNDKWIAGTNFNETTLFEDFLFLDKASRDIGNTILLDIFDLRTMFNENALNSAMSVFTFVSGILIKNNFTVMNLPAYVNFYNIEEVDVTSVAKSEGSLEFANSLWGTFLDVDYRKSKPKIVCFYVGKPSEYLDLPKNNFRFNNDGIDFRKSQSPLIEDQTTNRNLAFSNRCVGFNVDIGIRNQNIFYSFSVAQDPGTATSESINTLLNMVNQSSGRNTSTQNNGLYNLYKQRSYQCTVECLGNALIQPTMYFYLKHVPMFYGSYLITQVEHTIQPGNFTTMFNGVRQGYFDLPSIDSFIQKVNKNLLTRVEQLIRNRKDNGPKESVTNQQKANEVVQNSKSDPSPSNSCINSVNEVYNLQGFTSENSTETQINLVKFANSLIEIFSENRDRAAIIFAISYLRTFVSTNNVNSGEFKSNSFNYANIDLTRDYASSTQFFEKTYSCRSIKNTSTPIAHFKTVENYIDFMKSRINPNAVDQVRTIGLPKYYVCFWPTNAIPETYYDSNVNEFSESKTKIKTALSLAVELSILDNKAQADILLNGESSSQLAEQTTNSSQTNPTIPTIDESKCDPPVVSKFWPQSGVTNTIVNLSGNGFDSVTGITFNGVNLDKTNYTIYNDISIRFTVPMLNPNNDVEATIVVEGIHGNGSPTTKFQYKSQGVIDPSSAGPTI